MMQLATRLCEVDNVTGFTVKDMRAGWYWGYTYRPVSFEVMKNYEKPQRLYWGIIYANFYGNHRDERG